MVRHQRRTPRRVDTAPLSDGSLAGPCTSDSSRICPRLSTVFCLGRASRLLHLSSMCGRQRKEDRPKQALHTASVRRSHGAKQQFMTQPHKPHFPRKRTETERPALCRLFSTIRPSYHKNHNTFSLGLRSPRVRLACVGPRQYLEPSQETVVSTTKTKHWALTGFIHLYAVNFSRTLALVAST